MKKYIPLKITLIALLLTSSAIADFKLLGCDLNALSSEQRETKVLIYNNSDKSNNFTGAITVVLNGKHVCKLKIGEYIQIQLSRGEHKLTATRRDIINFTSVHNVKVSDKQLYIELGMIGIGAPTMKIHPRLPPKKDLPDPFFCVVKH